MKNIGMFWKINFEAIMLLQNFIFNKYLLQKADLTKKKAENKKLKKKTFKKLKPYIRMDKKIIKFDDNEIEK